MIKKSLFVFAGVMLFAIPLSSLAAAMSSSASVLVATSSVAVPPASVAIVPAACYPFDRSLEVGASGGDVTALQNYLKAQGYFSATATGYFGTITKAAVGRWQAQNSVAALGSSGNGTFGPLSRGLFMKLCGENNGNKGGGQGNNSSSAQTSQSFSATPQFGITPLTVQFIASAPQGSPLGNAVDFGDGTKGNLAFVPVCSNCNAEGMVSHTYVATGTYTAMLTNGVCSCPANGVCGCPNIQILATTTVTVSATSTATASNIQQLNTPGSAALLIGGIAEIRNESAYFTLQSIASSSATIQITPVGCWNSFPSDPKPRIVCMLALVPIPPQVLTVGQAYTAANYSITLTQLGSSTATFSVK
jgi:peptidoglycan hydrolase-like protein with peptidoglycan-binding domain